MTVSIDIDTDTNVISSTGKMIMFSSAVIILLFYMHGSTVTVIFIRFNAIS